MAHVQPGAVVFGQMAVAHGLNVFRQTVVPRADLAVLSVGHDGQAALGGDGERPRHDGVVHDAVAVLGDEFDILGQCHQVVERFAVKVLRDRDGLVGIAQPYAGGLRLNSVDDLSAGADRLCVGHQVHKGIPAGSGCGRAGGDILLILKAGGAPMAVCVKEGGQDRAALGVEQLLPLRDKQAQTDSGDFSVAQPDLDRLACTVPCVADQHSGNLLRYTLPDLQPAPCGRAFGQKKTFPRREKSKRSTGFENGKKHGTVNFEARNKLHHHCGTLLPRILTWILLNCTM